MNIRIRSEFPALTPARQCRQHALVNFSPIVAGESSRPPISLALVIDVSGSMEGEKLDQAKAAIAEILNSLTRRDRATLVSFSRSAEIVFGVTLLTDKPALVAKTKELKADGNTNLSGGWLTALDELEEHLDPSHLTRVILLTDGEANYGKITLSELKEIAVAWKAKGIATSTFGFGEGFNAEILKVIADASGGNFYFARNPEDIATAFRREFGELSQTTGVGCRLTLKLAEGVTMVEDFSGYTINSDGNSFQYEVGDLLEGVENSLLFQIESAPGFNPNGDRPLIELEGRYRQAIAPFERKQASSSLVVPPLFGGGVMRPAPEVLDEIILAKTNQAKKKAAEAIVKGDFAEALRLLESRETVIRDVMRNGLFNDFEKLDRELGLLGDLKKTLHDDKDVIGKTLQAQVEDFTKKRGAYVDARGGKKFVLNRRLRGSDVIGQRESIQAIHQGLIDLGADSQFISKCLVCFTEILTNTVDHGCKADPEALEFQVMVLFRKTRGKIHIVGPGPGFDVPKAIQRAKDLLANPPALVDVDQRRDFRLGTNPPPAERGRGIAFILHLTGEENLFYSDNGREVQLELTDSTGGVVTIDPTALNKTDDGKISIQNRREGLTSLVELDFTGAVDMYTISKLKDIISEILNGGIVNIIFRMENTDYIDSSGMGFFLKYIFVFRDAGGRFVLCGPSQHIMNMFHLINFTKHCEIFPNIDAARASFREK
ncbi:MAG: VWA domain-containing protein [Candidatus Riflebacteria bacterium]|nr:VWA domain-containing protein [Candidatus Riflebacteria bacterium]